MSVVRQLLQISAVQALRGRTLAKENVHDSTISALPDVMKRTRLPILIVSIEEADHQANGNDRGFFGRTAELKMQVQSAIFELTKTKSEDGGADDVLEYTLGETDAAMEAMLNIIDREWRSALTDPRNIRADVFRGLVTRIGRVQDMRAVDPELSRRHALRLTQVELSVIGEPVPGDPVSPAIEAGLAMLEGMADYAETAQRWRALLSAFDGLEDWEKRQAALFASRSEMDALGLAPLDVVLTDFESGDIDMAGLSSIVTVSDPEAGDA